MKTIFHAFTNLLLASLAALHAAERPDAAKVAKSSDATRESLAVSDGQLLLDSRVVAETKNARLTLGAVQKHASNSLMAEDKPWEVRFDNLYANALYDPADGLSKCWYSPFVVDRSSKGVALEQRNGSRYRPPAGREMGVCYAVSRDGLKWEKPELNLVAFEGSKANNLVRRGGQVKVTALDESSAVADSRVITTTSTRVPAGQLSPCRNRPVTLRLEITNAKVFSFGFSDSQ